MNNKEMTRRTALGWMCAGAASALAVPATGETGSFLALPAPQAPSRKFLWGAATAGHQVEGNTVNDDCWALENLPNSMFKEPSGDACNHYHLFEADIAMLASFGLDTYRFSIEWSRVEPVQGSFSNAELDHYRKMLETCHRHGVTPVVTYNHDATPLWFANAGGWEAPEAPTRFARYCSVVTKALGDLIVYALTLNEPDLPMMFRWISIGKDANLSDMTRAGLPGIRKILNQPNFSNYFLGDPDKLTTQLSLAHTQARQAIKAERSALPVGFTLAIEDDQDPPADRHEESHVLDKRRQVYRPWFDLAKNDDFIGVQNYARQFVGQKDLGPTPGAELTQSGWEFYPEGLEHVIRLVAKETGVPILVTENGIATEDDTRRVEFIRRAVAGVNRCRKDGIDVRGYIAWTLLDNFEWIFGYGPKYGLVAVDRTTQKRTPKPSAYFLGKLATQARA